ncbi:hypothetical protein DYB28_008029 [Aphanomyces astaci]|uniref:Glutathionylspermidine synthase pre-ATP-grasp-like domain-containing protein n=1 Tax=Aphanomyces astaci TaxID=112090 RepID=A0A9X8H7E6_APHAT|nr:hypothetical protein DYB28_008029 [Aphanomyces astaci]
MACKAAVCCRSPTSIDRVCCATSSPSASSSSFLPAKQPTPQAPLPNATSSDLRMHSIAIPSDVGQIDYLDASLPYVAVFQEQMGTSKVARGPTSAYYTLTESGQAGLEHATDELHRMFVHATQYVLDHQAEFAPLFHFPASLWPKIQQSWASRSKDVVAARFDFALTPHGLKTYEYNADSASCLFECGHSQDKWADVVGLGGRSNSDTLFRQLVAAWTAKEVVGHLHLLCDDDLEERYHSMYMQAAAQAAGIPCTLIVGIDSISFDNEHDGLFRDANNVVIQNVWKTWSWETVLKQYKQSTAATSSTHEADHLMDHHHTRSPPNSLKRPLSSPSTSTTPGSTKLKREDDHHGVATSSSNRRRSLQPVRQVMDILLHESVRVFEPLWTLLPSSKAILPVLSKLYPSHPYLLASTFDEADVVPMFPKGYCAKPVMGRTGANVSIYNDRHELISATGGAWDKDNILFQELALLPQYDGKYVQVNCWAIDGRYGGTILRVDESNIIGGSSGMYAMRVVPDDDVAPPQTPTNVTTTTD